MVITNLIGNAIKYTLAGGSIKIEISMHTAEGKTAEFSVTDTGIGITPEEKQAVFSGFHRTLEGQQSAAGFGIGLKVSKELLEAHGVRLQVESAPGKGSRFYFSLPVSPDAV